MAKLTDFEIIVETGLARDAFASLVSGLESHAVVFTPELRSFLMDWLRCRTIASKGTKITELSRRLGVYECVDHEQPLPSTCDICSGFEHLEQPLQ